MDWRIFAAAAGGAAARGGIVMYRDWKAKRLEVVMEQDSKGVYVDRLKKFERRFAWGYVAVVIAIAVLGYSAVMGYY